MKRKQRPKNNGNPLIDPSKFVMKNGKLVKRDEKAIKKDPKSKS